MPETAHRLSPHGRPEVPGDGLAASMRGCMWERTLVAECPGEYVPEVRQTTTIRLAPRLARRFQARVVRQRKPNRPNKRGVGSPSFKR
jgi:hypothetical protein